MSLRFSTRLRTFLGASFGRFARSQRVAGPGGYREVLTVSLPLVVSMGTITVMQVTDRIFLAHYATEAIAAALPAGLVGFLFLSFFMGMGGYVNVFVAQYTGAARPHRVGPAVWAGLAFSVLAAGILVLAGLLATPVFGLAGHPEAVRVQEEAYFRIFTCGAGLAVFETTLSAFFSGRGLTRTVMWVNFAGAALNIPLDYCLINGVMGFPELGIRGAAWATVAAWGFMVLIYVRLVFSKENEERFAVRSGKRLDRDLLLRLVRFGVPSGVQFALDMSAIAFFTLMIGRLGTQALAASNIALSINTLAFLPMFGLSIGVSILVGQAMGAGAPDRGAYATMSALHVALAYMGSVALLYLLIPGPLAELFRTPDTAGANGGADFAAIRGTVGWLLRFVALYSLFDAVTIICFGALKGAGDVAYVMKAMGLAAVLVMIVPVSVCIFWLDTGLWAPWACLTAYVMALAWAFGRRFAAGDWRRFTVIEAEPVEHKAA